MSVTEIVAKLKVGFEGELSKVDTVKLELQDKIASVDLIPGEVETEKKASYDKGFEDGLAQAGQAGGPDKIFSNEEMEAELAPLRAEIADLKAAAEVATTEKAELQAKVDEIPALKDQAVAEFKADLLAKYEAQQVAETDGETGFKALLA